jgi:hypothetical protein
MPLTLKPSEELVHVKEFITDKKGRKVAAIVEMRELKRIECMLKLIPHSERWLYKDKAVLQCVQKGLKDCCKGRISKLNLDEL